MIFRQGPRMTRQKIISSLMFVFVFIPPLRAELIYKEAREGENAIEVVRLTVTPAAEPVPALRHRLMSREIDLKAGNAAPYYYRALLKTPATMERLRKEFGEDFDTWYITGHDGTATERLPLDKLRKAVEMSTGGTIGQQLAEATSRRDCNWELNVDQIHGPEIISFELEEFQRSRDIGRAIALRARLAIAERRYDEAIDAMRINIRLGRNVANVPFLVCGLVGIAIEGIGNGPLLEFISSPESPNLYWALTELPEPLIDLRPAARFEMDFGPRMFPFIHNAETTDHSPQEWNRLLTRTLRDLKDTGGMPTLFGSSSATGDAVAAGLTATAVGLAGYSQAKTRLIAEGMDRASVGKMAVGQVIAIYTERNYRRFADDWENLWQVPFAQSEKVARRLSQKVEAARPFSGGENCEILPMVSLLLPALQASRQAQVRLDREVASLRVIEALRMYAAGHEGRLPERLEDIDQVPVPANPATGKPFLYRFAGATAILELPPSDRVASGNRRYEIQIVPKK
jgi:hypothetical protein